MEPITPHLPPSISPRDVMSMLSALAATITACEMEIVPVRHMPAGLRWCVHGHRVFLPAAPPRSASHVPVDIPDHPGSAARAGDTAPRLVALDGGRDDGPINASESR